MNRFWSKVQKTAECWIWTGTLDRCGYGVYWYNGKNVKAHRMAAKLSGMQIEGKLVCHTCDNPKCVKPSHLFVGTPADNATDRDRKGRGLKGKKQSLTHIANNAAAKRGQKRGAEFCRRMAVIRLGKRASDETRAKMSKARRGVPRPDLVGKTEGEKNGRAVLTAELVRQIRLAYSRGWTQAGLARLFHVSKTQVGRIVNREAWNHVT